MFHVVCCRDVLLIFDIIAFYHIVFWDHKDSPMFSCIIFKLCFLRWCFWFILSLLWSVVWGIRIYYFSSWKVQRHLLSGISFPSLIWDVISITCQVHIYAWVWLWFWTPYSISFVYIPMPLWFNYHSSIISSDTCKVWSSSLFYFFQNCLGHYSIFTTLCEF